MVMFKKSKLHEAINTGDTKVVKDMLDLGVDPNYTDDYGRSFLYFAVSRGNRDAAELLLQNGAKVDLKTRSDGTLLHLAAKKGGIEIAGMLLARQAELIGMKDSDGNTALHAAAEHGYAEMASFLIERGADPNLKNFANRTPLFLAQKVGYVEVSELLKPLTLSAKTTPQIEAAPESPPEPAAESPWKKLPGERIAHIAVEETIGYRITEIFNFSARERTTLYQNLDTKIETAETRSFDQIGDKSALEQALTELQKRGGMADAGSISGIDKKRLTP
ncbi:MAG: ankyrin repeat domain-containing protein [Alphaproteobacteria bacterium]